MIIDYLLLIIGRWGMRYEHFYDLPVYRCCREFRKLVSGFVKRFPKYEEYVLMRQALESSRSVTANIAEGFGRYHHQENIQFCRMARGSLTETMDHMITAFDENYLNEDEVKIANEKYKECLLQLNTYIKYLKSAKTQHQIINNQ